MISIVIPNYNGEALLGRHLPGVIEAARREGSAEVIVVDDASTDGSVALLCNEFPSVNIIKLEENTGFGRACMAGVTAAKGDILVLLNTDVSVQPDFLGPLREDLEDEGVFAVSAIDLNRGSAEAPGEVRHPRFRRGFLVHAEHRPSGPPPYETVFAPAGYAAYKKEMFLALGGFDPLYEPFYREDFDVCYRAWKRGWRTVVEPRSLVRHEHERGAILTAHGRARARAMERRNRFLFVWKNVTSRRMLFFRHLAPVAARVLLGWAVLDLRYYVTLGRALVRLPAALRGRREERGVEKYSDGEVCARFGPGG